VNSGELVCITGSGFRVWGLRLQEVDRTGLSRKLKPVLKKSKSKNLRRNPLQKTGS